MDIAVDNQVADMAINYLENKGFRVVFKAGHEPDNMWFRDAIDEGAEVFVSPDWDISFLCNQYNVKFIKLKQGLRNIEIGRFIQDRLEKGKFD